MIGKCYMCGRQWLGPLSSPSPTSILLCRVPSLMSLADLHTPRDEATSWGHDGYHCRHSDSSQMICKRAGPWNSCGQDDHRPHLLRTVQVCTCCAGELLIALPFTLERSLVWMITISGDPGPVTAHKEALFFPALTEVCWGRAEAKGSLGV